MSFITPQWIIIFAALNGALAVVLGAFGAHGLKGKLSETALRTYQTGVDYHIYHALALFGIGLFLLQQKTVVTTFINTPSQTLQLAAIFMILGICLFCGSLYGLALGGPKILGPITPLGGLCFICGWISIMYYSVKAL